MSTDVEIALVGERDPSGQLARHGMIPVPIPDEEATRSWSDRPRVLLAVSDDETLNDILDTAAESFGVVENSDWSLGWASDRFVAFRNDESLIPLEHRLSNSLTLVDEVGLAVWGVWDFKQVTLAQVRASADAGAIDGDPTQIYFHVRSVPAGGGVLAEWSLLTQACTAAWSVLEHAAVVGEVVALYALVRKRLRGRTAVERHAKDWVKRNCRPDEMRETLDGRPWQARDLAGLLGCTTDESESILELYGYLRANKPGVWVYAGGGVPPGAPATDPVAALLRAYIAGVLWNYADSPWNNPNSGVPPDPLKALFQRLLEEATSRDSDVPRTGNRPEQRRTNRD